MDGPQIKPLLERYLSEYNPIIKERGFNPYPVANKIPDFANTILFPETAGTRLHKEFWDEQIDRCVNGYTTGGIHLPGFYYQYLNFTTIDGVTGPISPYFIDLHYQMAVVIEQVKKYNLPGLILPKGRRKGISFFGDMIINNGIRFIPRYRAGLAAGLAVYCDGFRLKLYRIYNVCPPELRINHLIRSSENFKIGYEEQTAQGFQEYLRAEVLFKTMFDKAEKLEGEYFNDVFLEEAGQFPLVSDAKDSIISAMKDGEKYVGTMYIFGTGGKMEQSKQFKQIWHAADVLGFVKFFIAGKRYFVPYLRREEGEIKTPNLDAEYKDLAPEQLLGCEDIVAAAATIDKELTSLAKLPDKTEYIKFKQTYPKTVEDVFTSSGTNNFNVEAMYSQLYEVESHPFKHFEFTLDFVKDENGDIALPLQVIKGLPNAKTKDWEKVLILLEPRPDVKDLDVGGIDGYNEDNTKTTKSLGCTVVMRQHDKYPFLPEAKDYPGQVPVCLYYKRPPIKEQFWEMSLKISVYYNLLKNTMIAAESDAVIKYYKDNNGLKYLAKRPKSFDAPNSQMLNDYGVKMTGFSKPKMLGIVQSWVEAHIHSCWFVQILNDGIAYDEANIGTDWDSIDAVGYALMRIKDMAKKVQHSLPETTVQTFTGLPTYRRNANGILVQSFED
jgi:hypothetical protein